jgi:hypothetical protein
MLSKLFGYSSVALLSVLPALTTSVQAQTDPLTGTTVTVTNISGLERRALGGHKAKISYKVTLPEKFSLKKIQGTIRFKLIDGKFQTGNFSINNPKREDTIEVDAPGQLLAVDQQPKEITAKIKATAERSFKGTSNASFRPDGTLISQSDAFDLNIDIPKISNFKRQALGGHQVKVHYQTPAVPNRFTAQKLLVTATFNLDSSKTQTETVVKENNIALNGNQLIDTDGKVFKKEGEVISIATKVSINGIITDSADSDPVTETCVGTADCTN